MQENKPKALIMDGIELEVPEGTLLIFNPTSFLPDQLSAMKDVQCHAGGIIFQTKTEVLDTMTNPCFPSFPVIILWTPHYPKQIHYQISADPKEQEAFKFYPDL